VTKAEALALLREHLGEGFRTDHACAVGRIMRRLAKRLGYDQDAWEIVGLCHDLDFFATADDRTQHGLVAERWLDGRLSREALDAIAAHDHRTGRIASTPISDMLKLADALSLLIVHSGAIALTEATDQARKRLGERAYLIEIVRDQSSRYALDTAALLDAASDTVG
jgi:predicted hydrolase (HD superfamily)